MRAASLARRAQRVELPFADAKRGTYLNPKFGLTVPQTLSVLIILMCGEPRVDILNTDKSVPTRGTDPFCTPKSLEARLSRRSFSLY